MDSFLPFIVSGIATGTIFGLAGAGLVLTFKTSGIFNFAQGALATTSAYVFYFLHVEHGMSWQVSAILAVGVLGPIMGVLMELLARRLANRSTAHKVVATTGIILVVQGLATIRYGTGTLPVEQFLPKPQEFFTVAGVNVLYPQLWVTLIAVLAVGLLFVLLRYARIGLAMRAVVDDADLLGFQATNPVRVRRVSWIIGATFAALSGILILPFVGLNAIGLTFLVVQAFGAAALGGFTSIPLTFGGGVVIGIASALCTKYVITVDWLAGLPDAIPFIVLFAVLLLLPRNKLVHVGSSHVRSPIVWSAPGRVKLLAALIVLIPLLLVPIMVGDHLSFYSVGLALVLLLLSLGLLVRSSGQVSLCHTAFAAIGATTFSQLVLQAHIPWLLAVLLAALVVTPIGAMVAIPAIRRSGVFLALATMGFGLLVERLFYSRNFVFTTLVGGRSMPRPSFAEGDKAFYYVILAFVAAGCLLMYVIHRGRLGRILRGLSEAPVAAQALGLTTNVTRVIVFVISAFMAAVAGILYGSSIHFATASDVHYTSFYSLVLLALLAVSPFGQPWYALVGGISAVIPGYVPGANVTNWMNVLFGVFAIQVAIQGGHAGTPQVVRDYLDRLGGRRRRHGRAAPVPSPETVATAPARRRLSSPEPGALVARADSPGLVVRDLSVAFGGLRAVSRLSLNAPYGSVTGLIGPNGAGKTTAFNACSGLNRRATGSIRLGDADLSSMSPARRARTGLGRTFQIMELGESLTVSENVALGCEAGMAGGGVLSQLMATRHQRHRIEAAAADAMALCGISELADVQAGALSTGQRRLVELARCVAGDFDVLLLDEPSSGLDPRETEAFGSVLSEIVASRGCGILLVEHDMSLVMGVCDYIYVLDFGRLIFEGEPEAVSASPEVQLAYLGSVDDDVRVLRELEPEGGTGR